MGSADQVFMARLAGPEASSGRAQAGKDMKGRLVSCGAEWGRSGQCFGSFSVRFFSPYLFSTTWLGSFSVRS